MFRHLITRPFRVLAAVALAGVVFLLPVSSAPADPTSVSIPITYGTMIVNGTPVDIETVDGAALTGSFDPATGAFSGTLVIPAFTATGLTSLDNAFELSFSAVNAAVTGTIPQSGSGTLGPVGWTVGIALPDFLISGCSVAIAPLELTATFDPATEDLTLSASGFEIPGSTCAVPTDLGVLDGDESIVDAVLAIPTSLTFVEIVALDASALLAPPTPVPPAYTG